LVSETKHNDNVKVPKVEPYSMERAKISGWGLYPFYIDDIQAGNLERHRMPPAQAKTIQFNLMLKKL